MVLEERIPTERLPVYILRHACSLLGPMGVRSIQMTWKRRSRSGGNRCRVGGDRARARLAMDDGSHRKALLSRSSRPLGRPRARMFGAGSRATAFVPGNLLHPVAKDKPDLAV